MATPTGVGSLQQYNPITQQPINPATSGKSGILDYLSTPGGAALINAAGGGLAAYGQYQQNQGNQKQQALQFAATSLQQQRQQDQNNQMTRAAGAIQADPLGADQKFAQHNALLDAILPGMRNQQSHPGDPAISQAMGTRTGGVNSVIPQAGFDPNMVKSMFGPESTMNSIVQRHQDISNLDPTSAQPNLSSMYGNDPTAAAAQTQMKDWASKLQTAQGAEKQQYESQMQNYVNQMIQQEGNDGSGFWHKFAKIAGYVGLATAVVLTAGAATPLAAAGFAALGAASGAAQSWGSGGSPLQGAITGGLGTAVGGKIGKG